MEYIVSPRYLFAPTTGWRSHLAFAAAAFVALFTTASLQAQCTLLDWRQITASAYTTVAGDANLVYDDFHNEMLYLGSALVGTSSAKTVWKYNSNAWTHHSTTIFDVCSGPSVYAGNGITLTAGTPGCNIGTTFVTWEFNGSTWHQRATTRQPSPRTQHSMVYDSIRGVVVLFGGTVGRGGGDLNDTWEYSNGNWTSISTSTRPSARDSANLTFNSATGEVILFGGRNTDGVALRDTWIYNGLRWFEITGPQPQARYDARFAYDPRRNVAVLNGGTYGAGFWVDTWELDGFFWTVNPTPGGIQRTGPAAWDPETQCILRYSPLSAVSGVMELYGCSEPVITDQPNPANACVGGTIAFIMGARGPGTLSFQWQRNNVNIAGANASVYIKSPAALSDQASYSCVVTSQFGGVAETVAAQARVYSSGPTIVGGPGARSACVGESVTFSVTANNAAFYQWRKGGVDIPGAIFSQYFLPSVTTADAGLYSVLVSNPCGSITSSSALLIVSEPPNVIILGTTTRTVNRGESVSLNEPAFGTSPVRRWKRNGVDVIDGPGGASPGGGSVAGATASILNISNAQPSDSGLYALFASNLCGSDTGPDITLTVVAPPACPADLDDGTGTGTPDGGVTIEDLLYYLTLFADGNIAADLDDGSGTGIHDGGVTIDDLLFFLDHFGAGC